MAQLKPHIFKKQNTLCFLHFFIVKNCLTLNLVTKCSLALKCQDNTARGLLGKLIFLCYSVHLLQRSLDKWIKLLKSFPINKKFLPPRNSIHIIRITFDPVSWLCCFFWVLFILHTSFTLLAYLVWEKSFWSEFWARLSPF